MPEFDSIDLMNYAVYGNEQDPEWADIRNYIKSSASAQRELEELRRSTPQNDRKRRDLARPQELGRGKSHEPESSPRNANSLEEKKKWWSIFTGE
ncbi:hypothetical protein [Leptospira mayottensis]|uniref:Uncharacterized protein n=2 Tax=Leptospira mayottensis TaxID=1137606 RepID=A0AA87SWW0_9LEPT|nr:hypothetical protein [Leptospira mayottensis]AXR59923.1 hypothetical protein DQM68_03610 [Leptospira mayottensis]AXR63824.1 hypothetical protein DQM28_05855 [Leptospira mayottensis]AXR67475.1 hypothetical protein DPV73_05110 [Leptospira mayottensis]AZQ00748.1 hypothetical protein LEP1GSC190_00350 [Leptospira mayottensis 200901116]EKR99555.1 hypothetical protein LEP1GSC125_3219 [Leptospira mayottensis 200901122]